MNKRKKTLLALGMVLALAGIATSSAFIYKAATESVSGNLDSAIYLDWGDDEEGFKADPGTMIYGESKFKSLTVKAPQMSASVTSGTVDLTFTLGTNDGFMVEVSDKDFTKGSVATEDILFTVDKDNVDETMRFSVTEFTNDITLYFRLSLSHAPEAEEGQQKLSATFNASLTYNSVGVANYTISEDGITAVA